MSKVSNLIAVVASAILLTIPLASKAEASLPRPEASLPACVVEDGNGVPLCVWDGVISGDCAPDYVGGFDVMELCLEVYRLPAETHMYQGAEVSVPKGSELAQECAQEYNMMTEQEMKENGFSLKECFLAWL